MKKQKPWIHRFLEAKNFGFVIGLLLMALLTFWQYSGLFNTFQNLDQRMTDVFFWFKSIYNPTKVQQGVSVEARNPLIHPDILILGVESRTLAAHGRWPFPRWVYADLAKSLSRIQDSQARENSLFLDIFFVEPERETANDILLTEGFVENGRVFLETILERAAPAFESAEDYWNRHEVLFEQTGKIQNVTGSWEDMDTFLGLSPPLSYLSRTLAGYGHANFLSDDDETYRRQRLVAKSTRVLEEIPLPNLQTDLSDYTSRYIRYTWEDRQGKIHTVPSPLTSDILDGLKSRLALEGLLQTLDEDGDGVAEQTFYLVKKVQDEFIPSITLALALHYWNVPLENIEVVIGSHIRVPNPQSFDINERKLAAYRIPGSNEPLSEILIPIDEEGQMLINFMGQRSSDVFGEYQTFPVRSMASYSTRVPSPNPEEWPATRALDNKILMVGAFAHGIADDEKPTPYGLMYGVEIHANALNTMLMNNFLHGLQPLYHVLLLLGLAILTAFISGRLPTVFSMLSILVLLVSYFLTTTIVFEFSNLVIPFSANTTLILLTFISIVVYRVMTEERDKQKIRSMFGKYVSPDVVAQMMDNPPELGGVDKELTVLFSDIRGFTTLSEAMTPQELVNHLNLYLTAMTDTILDYKGTLDKYVGDEIMCFWGAPLEQADHAVLAAKCALKQMEVLNRLNEGWPEHRRIHIGIGLNSGIMTVGNMGSQGRMNYTLMGDNVNLGARLEGTNKEYKTNIIISEFTYGLIKDKGAIVRELDNIRVKGKNKPVLIYELIDWENGF